MRWLLRGQVAIIAVVAAACSGSKSAGPKQTVATSLAVGQSIVLPDSGQISTHLTVNAGEQYMIAVVNTANASAYSENFVLHGTGTAAAASAVRIAPLTATRAPLGPRAASAQFHPHLGTAGAIDPHLAMLEHDRTLVRNLIAKRGNPIASFSARRAARIRAGGAAALRAGGPIAAGTTPGVISDTVGTTSRVFIRNNISGSCASVDTVTARTVYASSKLLVLEDVASAYAHQLDAFYVDTLAPEYDAKTYPEVVANFGDPLLVDTLLTRKGRVTVLFSPVLNTVLKGVAGFVNPCDFFPTNSAPPTSDTAVRSNETEIFYAFVPDSGWPPVDWKRFIRSVSAHETKHVASFAQHLVDSAASFEESWLEEATAQASAEIWMRQFTGEHWKGNNGYSVSVGCELSTSICPATIPFDLSQSHFVWLYEFLSRLETESVLGPSTEAKYGGSWSFARWATDQYGASEGTFLKAIIDDRTNTGLANLSAHTGRPIAEMLLDFYLASASNHDTAGFVPQDAALTLPSWDERDIYAQLNMVIPRFFALPYPLVPRPISSGAFDIAVSGIRGGGASVFLLSTSGSGSQHIALNGSNGLSVAPSTALRLGIVRVR